jgi:hypothetical protein
VKQYPNTPGHGRVLAGISEGKLNQPDSRCAEEGTANAGRQATFA